MATPVITNAATVEFDLASDSASERRARGFCAALLVEARKSPAIQAEVSGQVAQLTALIAAI